ncbi:uncharacterized protein LOC113464084 [Ceratina calcarata]|uniref:Uncharacterized protein LOC113464084 n=1 Tax=Ceratina calcarata TaxID=156304 RepID=A0AAJ7RYT9_9HYME|nr:uncharacterized protein LOC113464084 [Ceratina calcarata]
MNELETKKKRQEENFPRQCETVCEIIMHENRKKTISHRCKLEVAAVLKLDEYIKRYERKFGEISSLSTLSREQSKLLSLVRKLKEVIEKEELDKQQAFELLKTSNEAIKKTISTFQESMQMCKENMRTEFAKVECLSTNRLLSINYTCI